MQLAERMLPEMTSPFDIEQRQAKLADTSEEGRKRRDQRESDVKWVMSSPSGRRFIRRFLDVAGIYRSSMTEGLEMVAFNEGRRDTGLRILSEITSVTPDEYLMMLKENLRADA